jgi:hypothetical protein
MNMDLFSHIDWLHVLVAAIAYFALGAIWYSKPLFAPKWAAYVGVNMSDPNANKKGLGAMMLGSFILIVITCIALAILVNRLALPQLLSSGIKLGALTGLCIGTTAMSISFIYERRPLGLYFIDGGYHVVGNLAAAIILVMWR